MGNCCQAEQQNIEYDSQFQQNIQQKEEVASIHDNFGELNNAKDEIDMERDSMSLSIVQDDQRQPQQVQTSKPNVQINKLNLNSIKQFETFDGPLLNRNQNDGQKDTGRFSDISDIAKKEEQQIQTESDK